MFNKVDFDGARVISGDIWAILTDEEIIDFKHKNREKIALSLRITKTMAIQQDWNTLKYVKEQTPELCIIAVKQNRLALCSVKEQTFDICLAAVKHDADALKFISDSEIKERVKAEMGGGEIATMSLF